MKKYLGLTEKTPDLKSLEKLVFGLGILQYYFTVTFYSNKQFYDK